MKYIIRFFMTLPVIFLFGFQGVAMLWRFGGKFSVHGKDYEAISREATSLLSDLRDIQNGPPLERYREEWIETMRRVNDFLSKHE